MGTSNTSDGTSNILGFEILAERKMDFFKGLVEGAKTVWDEDIKIVGGISEKAGKAIAGGLGLDSDEQPQDNEVDYVLYALAGISFISLIVAILYKIGLI